MRPNITNAHLTRCWRLLNCAHTQRALPHEAIVYVADRASFPYGQKTWDELKAIIPAKFCLIFNRKPTS